MSIDSQSFVFVPPKTIILIQCPRDDLTVYYGVIGFFTHHGFAARKGDGVCMVRVEMIDHSKAKVLEWDEDDWSESYYNPIKGVMALFPAIDQENSIILSAKEIIFIEKNRIKNDDIT